VIEARLIEYANTQVFLLAIGLRHLEASIDLADSWDVLRDKGPKL